MKKNMNNNQYLCKAKRTFNGDWITGCLLVFDDEYRIATSCLQSTFEDEPDAVLEVCTYKVDPSTVCRCVGIEDKNGRLIWENDIVKHDFGKDQIGVQFAIVKYDSKYACYQIEPIYDWMYCDKSDCEVVGNVFDNPELLEETGIKKETDMEDMEL